MNKGRPTAKQSAAGFLAAALVFAGLAAGTVQVASDEGHARVDLDEETARATDITCARVVAVGPSRAWAALGLGVTRDYATGFVCSSDSSGDDKAADGIQLPHGIRVLEQDTVPFEPGMARLEVWASSHSKSPRSACACAPSSPGLLSRLVKKKACTRLIRTPEGRERWEEAPAGAVMQPGEWRGECVALATCVEAIELGVGSAIPEECLSRETLMF